MSSSSYDCRYTDTSRWLEVIRPLAKVEHEKKPIALSFLAASNKLQVYSVRHLHDGSADRSPDIGRY